MTLSASVFHQLVLSGEYPFVTDLGQGMDVAVDAKLVLSGELAPVTLIRHGSILSGKLTVPIGVTVSRIRYVFPEFSDTTPVLISRAISQMEATLNADLETNFRNTLIEYAVAHRLTLIERGKLITQGGIGLAARGKEVKFVLNTEEYWLQTEYGRIYWETLSSTGGVGMLIV